MCQKLKYVLHILKAIAQQLKNRQIAKSAQLYQEIYEEDEELQELTNDAI